LVHSFKKLLTLTKNEKDSKPARIGDERGQGQYVA
jgi:ribosomal protein L27